MHRKKQNPFILLITFLFHRKTYQKIRPVQQPQKISSKTTTPPSLRLPPARYSPSPYPLLPVFPIAAALLLLLRRRNHLLRRCLDLLCCSVARQPSFQISRRYATRSATTPSRHRSPFVGGDPLPEAPPASRPGYNIPSDCQGTLGASQLGWLWGILFIIVLANIWPWTRGHLKLTI